jgi:metallo-beta-lactamase class B
VPKGLLRAVVLALVLAVTPRSAPAQDDPSWREPFDAFRIVGNLYYVGTRGLASFLFATPEGHVLIDTGVDTAGPLLRASMERLGLHAADIRVLLDGHAHFDHVGTHAEMQRLSGARVMVMRQDADAMSTGRDLSALGSHGWPAVNVDRVLEDGDTVSLGGTTLTAHRTPGHTAGCTTWTTTVAENGRRYRVVIACSVTVVAARLADAPPQPTMVEDYARSFAWLETLKPDVWLTEHGELFDLEDKRRAQRAGAAHNPFVDPAGYAAFIAKMKEAYKRRLASADAARPAS